MKALILVALVASVLVACNDDTGFQGDNAGATKERPSANAEPTPHAEASEVSSVPADDFVPPPKAVTKGSFTAWTEPQNPPPGQMYTIVIRVQLRSGSSFLDRSDLSGGVTGTDNYRQNLGDPVHDTDFQVEDGAAILKVAVPGGMSMVRDTIDVRSSLLDESQVLTLVFQ